MNVLYIQPSIEIKKSKVRVFKEPAFKEPAFETITTNEILGDTRDYILVGDSGLGKTSFLYWLGLLLSLDKIDKIASRFIPIFLHLKDLAEINTTEGLRSLINTKYKLDNYESNGNRFLFLLDGLDQIIDHGNLVDRLRSKDIFGKENKIILATRPVGYESIKDRLVDKYSYLRILPFDEKKIVAYMEEYYHDPNFEVVYNRHKELLKIPILLRLLKILLAKGQFPEVRNRADIYELSIKHLFQREQDKKSSLYSHAEAVQVRQDLEMLSYQAVANSKFGSFSIDFGLKYSTEDRLNKLIYWSITHNLIEKEAGKEIVFSHQSFQEYLAACYINSQQDARYSLLKGHLFNPKWLEVIKFTIGMIDNPSNFLLFIQRQKPPYYKLFYQPLLLAGHCMVDLPANKVDSSPNGNELKILDRLFILWEKTELQKLRQMINEVFASMAWTSMADKIVGYLLSALKNKDWSLNLYAIESIGYLGRTEDKIIDALVEKVHKVKFMDYYDEYFLHYTINALDNLARIDDTIADKAVKVFIKGLNHLTNFPIRCNAALALGNLGRADDNIINALTAALQFSFAGGSAAWITWSHNAAALAKLKRTDVKVIVSLLDPKVYDEYEYTLTCWDTADVLATMSRVDDKIVEVLFWALSATNEYVRANAALTLGYVKHMDEKILEVLLKALDDAYKYVRWNAAFSLSNLGHTDDKVIEMLFEALNSKEEKMCWNASKVLGKLSQVDKSVNEALLNALKAKNKNLKWNVAMALGSAGCNDDKVLNELIKALKAGHMAEYVADVLAQHSNVDYRIITALINETNNNNIDKCRLLIGKVGYANEKVVKALIKHLESGLNPHFAAEELGELGIVNKKIMKALHDKINDKDSLLRDAAYTALQKLVEKQLSK